MAESSADPPARAVGGVSSTDFTFLGSTGNKCLPPSFCHSANDRDLNDVTPVFPRSFPAVFDLSFAFIFSHCSFDMPLGMYSIVKDDHALVFTAKRAASTTNKVFIPM